MGTIEFDVALINGKLIYDGKVTLPIEYDGFAKTLVTPGFADAHAHPQVIDVGEKRRYKNSYDWIKRRKLRIDEKAIREDPDISSRLAAATMLLSVFDGVTLIALTGSVQGNVMALRSIYVHPRVVLQPTILDRKGWLSPQEFLYVMQSFLVESRNVYVGLFLHSLGLASLDTVRTTIRIAKEKDLIMAMHLSEGVYESQTMRELAAMNDFDAKSQLVVVHCFTEPSNCKKLFRGVVSCPTSNMYLYGRTIRSPSNYDALGSDWPLVTGTLRTALSQAHAVSVRRTLDVLINATIGGYRIYGVDWVGDALIFDSDLAKVLESPAEKPKYVFLEGREVIREGTINGSFDYRYVEKMKENVIKQAFEKYPVR